MERAFGTPDLLSPYGHFTKEPVAYLTYAIWAFITEPFASAHALAYATAFFVTCFVLIISVISRGVLDENAGWRARRLRQR